MAITITHGGITLNLPIDLLWSDQYSWSPVEQTEATSITGALLIDVAVRTRGRHITLVGDPNFAWFPYATVDQLKSWAAIPGCEMALSIGGTNYPVIFRHHEKPAIDVYPVVAYSLGDNADFFYGTLKLMEI